MEELFNAEFLATIKSVDPFLGIQKLCHTLSKYYQDNLAADPIELDKYNTMLNAYSFIHASNLKWHLGIDPTPIGGERRTNLHNILSYISRVSNQAEQIYSTQIIQEATDKYNLMFGNEFYYELDDNNFTKIQSNINELRELITKSKEIPLEHRDRLLKRLEELQKELNKRVRNFDRYFGIAIEVSSYVGQFCENIKPFNDRLKEILDIIAKVMKISTGAILLEQGQQENKSIEKR